MSPHTKTYVKNVRLVQLALRSCALLGAMGMLFCVICIKKTESTVGWVLRVAVCLICFEINYEADSPNSLLLRPYIPFMPSTILPVRLKHERRHHQPAI